MKKDMLRAVIIAFIVLAVYHLIAFLTPFVHTEAFWISYSFTLAAFAVVATSFYLAFIKHPDVKSRFYGFPIARIGVIYGIVQLVLSLIFMGVGLWVPGWIPALVYAVALGLAAIGLIGAQMVVDEIKTQDTKQKINTATMRALQSKISQLAAQSEDAAIKALAEEFRYCDPVSNEAIADAEADLAAAVDQLQAAFVDGDSEATAQLCRKASTLLAERNRLCKLNKK